MTELGSQVAASELQPLRVKAGQRHTELRRWGRAAHTIARAWHCDEETRARLTVWYEAVAAAVAVAAAAVVSEAGHQGGT